MAQFVTVISAESCNDTCVQEHLLCNPVQLYKGQCSWTVLVLWQCNAVKLACKNIAVFYIVQIQCKFLCKSSGIVEKIQCKLLFKSSLNLCANPVQIVVQIQCKTTKQHKPVRLDQCVRDLLQIFH